MVINYLLHMNPNIKRGNMKNKRLALKLIRSTKLTEEQRKQLIVKLLKVTL
jgi:hypothetical protein